MAKTPDKTKTQKTTTTKTVKPDSVTFATKGRAVPQKTAKQTAANKKNPHKLALRSAALAARRTDGAGKKAERKLEAHRADVRARKFALQTPIAVRQTHVGGIPQIEIGASVPKTAALTVKQKTAIAKHTTAVVRMTRAARGLDAAVKKAKKTSRDAADFVTKTVPFLRDSLAGKRKGKIAVGAALLGLVQEHGDHLLDLMHPEELDAIGACIGLDAQGLAPGQPGYDPTTDPDAQQQQQQPPADTTGTDADLVADAGKGGVDPKTGVVKDCYGQVLYDPAQDPDVTPLPERGKPLPKDEAMAVWQNVPENGIVFADVPGEQEVGTWGIIYDQPWINERQGRGLIWHQNPGDIYIKWWRIGYAQEEVFPGIWKDVGPGHGVDAKIASTDEAAQIASRYSLGPLVGARRLAGLQYAVADKKWFWQGQYAPVWAAAEADAKIALANKKLVAANTATALAAVKQQQLELAEAAAKAAKADAEAALAQKQADTEANILKTKSEAEAAAAAAKTDADRAAADTEYQRQQDAAEAAQAAIDADYQRVQVEAMRRKAEMNAAEQHAIIEQAEVWNAWARQNPAEAMRQMQPEADYAQAEPEPDFAPDFEEPAPYDDEPPYEGDPEQDGQVAAYDPRSDAYDEVVGGAYGGWDHYEIGEEMV